jgi:hypothetical protein
MRTPTRRPAQAANGSKVFRRESFLWKPPSVGLCLKRVKSRRLSDVGMSALPNYGPIAATQRTDASGQNSNVLRVAAEPLQEIPAAGASIAICELNSQAPCRIGDIARS